MGGEGRVRGIRRVRRKWGMRRGRQYLSGERRGWCGGGSGWTGIRCGRGGCGGIDGGEVVLIEKDESKRDDKTNDDHYPTTDAQHQW
jgi:hypothetical protein